MADQEKEKIPHRSPFDAIRHESEQYGEYWSGRELYKLLGYTRWENFRETIERAKLPVKSLHKRLPIIFTQR